MAIKTREEHFGTITYDSSSDKFSLDSTLPKEELLSQKLSAPLTLHWITTMKCNARCSYCYELPYLLKPKDKEQTFSSQELEKVIEQFAQQKVFRLYLTGGEPTLSPLLPDIVRLAQEREIKTVVNTNGLHMSEELYAVLRDNQSRLSFSLDSYLKDEHNTARRQKSHESIVKIMQRAGAEGVEMRVISVLQKKNAERPEYYLAFGKFLQGLGVQSWFLQEEINEKKKKGESEERQDREYEKNAEGELEEKPEMKLEEKQRPFFKSLEAELQKNFPHMRIRVLPAIYASFLYLLPNGEMGIHLWDEQKEIYGNLLKKSLQEIWQKHRYATVKDHEGILRVERGKEK